MKRINCLLVVALICLLGGQTAYCAKKSKASAKKNEQPVASEPKAEVYVFPVETEKPAYKPVDRVLTGIFTQKQQEKAVEEEKAKALTGQEIKKREAPKRTLNEKTIAWTTPMNIYYHDPMNNCLKVDERNWAEENSELVGLEPCPDCFKKRDMVPAFIKKQCGNLDIAEAKDLLVNSKFIEWAKERMPVKDLSFISGSKMLIIPQLDMTSKGMHQLAKEAERAYLRQTWRVIEVQVKSDSDISQYVSSFSPEATLLGEVKESEGQERMTNIIKVRNDLKQAIKGAVRPTGNQNSSSSKNKKRK